MKLLSFNVFLGSPAPGFGHWTPCLRKSTRFHQQVAAIRELDPDVICLQEAWGDVADDFAAVFASTHKAFRGTERRVKGPLVFFGLHLLLSALLLTLSWYGVFEVLTYHVMNAVIMIGMCVLGETAFGQVALSEDTGLLTLVRHNIRVATHFTKAFDELRGEPLNWIASRGYQIVFTNNGTIINAHLNALGPDEFRVYQVNELVRQLPPVDRIFLAVDANSDKDAVLAPLLESLRRCSTGSTWVKKNPLTGDFYTERDYAPDHIYISNDVKARGRVVFDSEPWLSDHLGLFIEERNQ